MDAKGMRSSCWARRGAMSLVEACVGVALALLLLGVGLTILRTGYFGTTVALDHADALRSVLLAAEHLRNDVRRVVIDPEVPRSGASVLDGGQGLRLTFSETTSTPGAAGNDGNKKKKKKKKKERSASGRKGDDDDKRERGRKDDDDDDDKRERGRKDDDDDDDKRKRGRKDDDDDDDKRKRGRKDDDDDDKPKVRPPTGGPGPTVTTSPIQTITYRLERLPTSPAARLIRSDAGGARAIPGCLVSDARFEVSRSVPGASGPPHVSLVIVGVGSRPATVRYPLALFLPMDVRPDAPYYEAP